MIGFARLPISVTIMLSVFSCRVSLCCVLSAPFSTIIDGHHASATLLTRTCIHSQYASEFYVRLEVDVPLRESRKTGRRP